MICFTKIRILEFSFFYKFVILKFLKILNFQTQTINFLLTRTFMKISQFLMINEYMMARQGRNVQRVETLVSVRVFDPPNL
jgi:hypothetical protein